MFPGKEFCRVVRMETSSLFFSLSPVLRREKKGKEEPCLVIVHTFGNKVSTSLIRSKFWFMALDCLLFFGGSLKNPVALFFTHCFVSKQVASLTALFVDLQSGPKKCGKATREDFLSSVRACQSKISKRREIWNYIFSQKNEMQTKKLELCIDIYI